MAQWTEDEWWDNDGNNDQKHDCVEQGKKGAISSWGEGSKSWWSSSS